jgi:hypothetical protein
VPIQEGALSCGLRRGWDQNGRDHRLSASNRPCE